MKDLFLATRFYYVMVTLIAAMMLSYPFPLLLPFVQTALVLLGLVVVIDMLILFNRSVVINVERDTPQVLSLGDDNTITITLQNRSGISFHAEMIDELPEQFQVRDFSRKFQLAPGKQHRESYSLRPLARGEYTFGHIHLFLSTALGLVRRRLSTDPKTVLPVYPSIIQMKKYEISNFARSATEYGVKRMRRVGHSYEFEHIKQYIRGDDYRSINWKATGRRATLMVNQYEDEKSQQIYCVIDKSRVMHMPFNGLSLFDYAVNTSLVISNIVLGKQDKAGLITFAEAPKALVKAERSKGQLKKIIETLYKEKEGSVEANYESLYMITQKFIAGRCMMFLFTNFDSTYALQRVLPQLQKLNDKHLLVVVFFENSEVTTQTSLHVETLEDVYTQVTAEHFALTKIQLVQELRQAGIMSILTKPEALTVTTINKYLEVKSRGMI
ncbi:DUF58 domain-containing protein [Fulvivirgaceae bacterium PWU4]|uniref:DUF58 domain-containing protein n=1 Tax=Chryseosolibacter histidini TaxID=2782349 RepID=A0AAP2DP80_9BACT|nr:DUF58 domain-containing protein [Chryseosolibacter histidini]MBT1698702.1 DUF58 domain-containing protein [Chryseosolibacter histidini]